MNGAILIGSPLCPPANELVIPGHSDAPDAASRLALRWRRGRRAAGRLLVAGRREDSFLLSDLQRVPLAVRHDAPGDPAEDGGLW